MRSLLHRHWHLALILLGTVLVYGLSLKNGFVNLDDPLLITENKHVLEASFANVWYVLTHFDPELYIPITFLSYQLETWTLGTGAWHFHLINLLLHLGSITLVFHIIKKIAGSPTIAIATAALFAFHPINAEAVLWVSARKDILAGFFSLAALAMYLEGSRRAWIWSVLLFVLALGSKVSAVALPLVLLLVEHKEYRRTAPYFALSIFFGVIAIVGKTYVTVQFEWSTLIVMAFRSTLFYLQLLFIPTGQSAVHSISTHLFPPANLLAFAIVIGATCGFWKTKKKWPLLWFGWAFFLATLAPTFLHYTRGGNTLMLGSERYAYLSSIGIFLIVSTLWSGVYEKKWELRIAKKLFLVASLLIVAVLAFLSLLRTFVFEDSIIFNMDILQKYPGNARASYNFGIALEADRKPMSAENAYHASMLADPEFADPAINLGILYIGEGRHEEGIDMLKQATQIRPTYFKGYFNLGVAYQQLGKIDEAINAYVQTIELFPDFPEARKNLATMYGEKKMFKEALQQYEMLAQIDPGFRASLEQMKALQSVKK